MAELFSTDLEEKITFIITCVMFLFGLASFCALLKGPAPYGRYYADQTFSRIASMRRLFECQVPGRIGWIVMESPNVLAVLLLTRIYQDNKLPLTNALLLGLFLVHYIHRAFIFPFLQKSKPHTLLSFIAACAFCCMNGYNQATTLTRLCFYPSDWISSYPFIVGVCMFSCGFGINVYSDYILRTLRKPGETGYKIPRGGLFEYVSAANFFGEIVEWLGFALACSNLAAVSFAWATMCNLIPRGIFHHKYYLEKFEDYPKNRKAVIPFLV